MSGIDLSVKLRPLTIIRPCVARWTRTRTLVRQLQRIVQTNARLDLTTRGNWQAKLDAAGDVERVLGEMAAHVDDEIGRLTCEMLSVELARRQARETRKK